MPSESEKTINLANLPSHFPRCGGETVVDLRETPSVAIICRKKAFGERLLLIIPIIKCGAFRRIRLRKFRYRVVIASPPEETNFQGRKIFHRRIGNLTGKNFIVNNAVEP